MSETNRIRWHDEAEASMTACIGCVGTVDPFVFQIHKPLPSGGPEWSEWILSCRLPGMEGKRHYGDSAEELKPAAERWLCEFVVSLGAIFPESPGGGGRAVKNTRLAGHGLKAEGKPFTWSDRDGQYVRVYPAHEREGRGLCECGQVSPVLESHNARQRWHAAHKEGFTSEEAGQ